MWVGAKGICALLALAAVLFLPPRLVRYNACCYADEGDIPGVTCCGRPKLPADQESLTRHRTCCEPFVFESVTLNVVTAVVFPTTNIQLASIVADAPVSQGTCVIERNTLANLRLTGPPVAGTPIYVLLERYLI